MPTETSEMLRVIIQFVRSDVPGYSRYRLVVYGNQNFHRAESASVAELAQRFESAGVAPEHRPSIPIGEVRDTSIVYARDLALPPTQLKIRGVGK